MFSQFPRPLLIALLVVPISLAGAYALEYYREIASLQQYEKNYRQAYNQFVGEVEEYGLDDATARFHKRIEAYNAQRTPVTSPDKNVDIFPSFDGELISSNTIPVQR